MKMTATAAIGHRFGPALARFMTMEQQLSIRDTARAIAIRAGLLTAAGLAIGGLLASGAMKAAGTLLKASAYTGAALLLGGVATYEVRKVQKRIAGGAAT
jgi:hypothetical protein